jgi:protein TonB
VSIVLHAILLVLLSRIVLVPLVLESEPMEVFLWREPSRRGEKVQRSETNESTVQTSQATPAKSGTPGRVSPAEEVSEQTGADVVPPEVPGEDIALRKQQLIAEEQSRRAEWEKSWRSDAGLPAGDVGGIGGVPREQQEQRAASGEALGIQGPVGQRKILFSQLPEYPDWAKRQGVEGEVLLKFWVSPEGLVTRIEIARFSGFRDFDDRAARALQSWRFEPIGAEAEKTEQWGTVPFKFRLEKSVY